MDKTDYRTIQVRPLSGILGAEIDGVVKCAFCDEVGI